MMTDLYVKAEDYTAIKSELSKAERELAETLSKGIPNGYMLVDEAMLSRDINAMTGLSTNDMFRREALIKFYEITKKYVHTSTAK